MKIRIFGGTASGKSTLAAYLSKSLSIPTYSTDSFVFDKKSKRRLDSARIKLINRRLKKNWIVEGVHFAKWCEKTYSDADLIIISDRSFFVLVWRTLLRYLRHEKSHYSVLTLIRLLFLLCRDNYVEVRQYYKIAKLSGKPYFVLRSNDFGSVLEWSLVNK